MKEDSTDRLSAVGRIRDSIPHWSDPHWSGVLGAVVCVIALVIFGSMGFPPLICLVAAWDAAALLVFLLLLLRFILGITMPCIVERAEARAQDEGFAWIILRGFVVVMSVAVLVLTFLVLRRPEDHVLKEGQVWLAVVLEGQVWLPVVLGLAAVVGAWASMHLAFALHYARLHYKAPGNPNMLSFPDNKEKPTDLDFAYFAFMIGMAFSGADVDVCGSSFRGWVLIHAMVSFVFNTAILALAINLAFNLLS